MTSKQLEFVELRLQSIQINYYYALCRIIMHRIVKNFDVK